MNTSDLPSESILPAEPEPLSHLADTAPYFSQKNIENQIPEIIEEIVILQSYARSVSKNIPENVLNDLSTLVDSCLNNKDKLGETLKLALSVHGGLSQVVAPVSVRSLKATDPSQGLFSWIKQVWAIPVIFIFTLLAFGAYIYHSDLNDHNKTAKPTESPENK